jgi:outer membrane protein OmpA-like peptidoglycan-associated protein
LTAGDVEQLDKLATVMSNPKVASIGGSIVGHTDSVGSEAFNMGLSQRRAESVAGHLRSQGVDLGSAWTVTGMGESQPIATNDTAEGRAMNRRVEVTRSECGK